MSTSVPSIDAVRNVLTRPEQLAGLAEEATELAHAALKLRRAIDQSNPTPVTVEDATANLLEEIGDVLLCLEVLQFSTCASAYIEDMQSKLTRWVDRLHKEGADV